MRPITARFPGFDQEKFVEVTRIVVNQRNAVAKATKMFSQCGLGFAILACDATRTEFRQIERTDEFPWLTYRPHRGLAYTLYVEKIPVRVQPDCPEIRDVLPDELEALGKLFGCHSGGLFSQEASTHEVLRLEIAQRTAELVEQVDLHFVNAKTGATLDTMNLYRKDVGYSSSVTAMQLDPETPDLSNLFSLPPANDDVETSGDDDK